MSLRVHSSIHQIHKNLNWLNLYFNLCAFNNHFVQISINPCQNHFFFKDPPKAVQRAINSCKKLSSSANIYQYIKRSTNPCQDPSTHTNIHQSVPRKIKLCKNISNWLGKLVIQSYKWLKAMFCVAYWTKRCSPVSSIRE